MKIDIFATQNSVQEKELKDKTVVVVDVFRATTTIIAALHNGCREVIPVAGIEEAIAFSRNYDKNAFLLGGERNIHKIDGFDLSNSPLEYTRQAVEGRTIIITTTNGTKAIRKTQEAKEVLIAGFVNVSAVAAYLNQLGDDTAFVCAGTDGKFSLEDVLAVGSVLSKLKSMGCEVVLDDLGLVCVHMFEMYRSDIKGFLKETTHYRRLMDEKLEKDIDMCLDIDSIPVVPVFKDGVIRINAKAH
jgi:2-phosphosulfolactate phosphatase